MPPRKRSPLTDLAASPVAEPPAEDLPAPMPDSPSIAKSQPAKRRTVKVQSLYLKPKVHKQLQMIAVEEDCKMHDLVLEGLDRVFRNRGRPSIKELEQITE